MLLSAVDFIEKRLRSFIGCKNSHLSLYMLEPIVSAAQPKDQKGGGGAGQLICSSPGCHVRSSTINDAVRHLGEAFPLIM